MCKRLVDAQSVVNNFRTLLTDVTHNYTSFISSQEEPQQMSQRVATTERDRQALIQMLVSGEDTFFGRWKKNKKKRAANLGEAFPDRNLISGDSRRPNATQTILLAWLKWKKVVDDATQLPKILVARMQHARQ